MTTTNLPAYPALLFIARPGLDWSDVVCWLDDQNCGYVDDGPNEPDWTAEQFAEHYVNNHQDMFAAREPDGRLAIWSTK